MSTTIELKVPDLGNFSNIDVIEVLVQPGQQIVKDTPLLTLETDKATMEVPATAAGVVQELRVKVGDKVSAGSVILLLQTDAAAAGDSAGRSDFSPTAASGEGCVGLKSDLQNTASSSDEINTEVLVLGGGPGGYTAAFRAADLGKQVTLVERYPTLGGVCLNVGCIPSKALLHVAKVITEAEEMSAHGVSFGKPQIDINRVRGFKESVVGKLTKGLAGLAKQRKVNVVQGVGQFTSPNTLQVTAADGAQQTLRFQHCIVAAGSAATKIPGYPYEDSRLIDSTGALALADIPKKLLVIGGGIIGLEMACVYDALGSEVSVVELGDGLIPGADRDLVKVLETRLRKRYAAIMLGTKVSTIGARPEGLRVHFEGTNAPSEPQLYDKVLVAVGRRPNGKNINAEAAGVSVDERGFIPVDKQCRTNVAHIFAIGDIVGQPMLAHKATHEGKVAAEVIAGHKSYFDARTIPGIAYTDPEVAWMGLTETEAKAKGIAIETASFPWAASGRALGNGRDDGITKLIIDPESKGILGAGIVGVNAGELLAEAVLALEMNADIHDLALSVHAHPTLSETLAMAAEMADGSITDLFVPKKKLRNS
jgi:dihydrolipoamide dehydrogenase